MLSGEFKYFADVGFRIGAKEPVGADETTYRPYTQNYFHHYYYIFIYKYIKMFIYIVTYIYTYIYIYIVIHLYTNIGAKDPVGADGTMYRPYILYTYLCI
jgi:hypothetical protein